MNCDKTDADQDHKASALLKAFTAVLDCITGQKKVVLLSSLHLHYIVHPRVRENGFANPEYRSTT